MNTFAKFFSVLSISSLLASCTGISKTDMGTITGGIGGALLGSHLGPENGKLFGMVFGGMVGGYLGRKIGQSLDAQDKRKMELAFQESLEKGTSGNIRHWHNPDTGVKGSFSPSRAFNHRGRVCRNYKASIVIDGEIEKATGIACRNDRNGQWVIQNSNNRY